MRIVALVFALAAPAAALSQTIVDGSETKVPQGDFAAVIAARIGGRLKDPASAQYRNLGIGDAPGTASWCGEVNARNGFGGYAGFKPFLIVLDRKTKAVEVEYPEWPLAPESVALKARHLGCGRDVL
jgi:hypothetical protein